VEGFGVKASSERLSKAGPVSGVCGVSTVSTCRWTGRGSAEACLDASTVNSLTLACVLTKALTGFFERCKGFSLTRRIVDMSGQRYRTLNGGY